MAYLYRHIRLDKNEPFYIGIGSDGNYKRANSKQDRNKHWNSVVNKTDYEVEILLDNLSWDVAQEKEKEFINLYGRRDLKRGSLVNWTDGGEGCLGIIVSDETKSKISKATKGKKLSEDHKRKLSLVAKNRNYSEEYSKILADRISRAKEFFSENRNQKISATLKEKYKSGERVSATKGKEVSSETRDKLRKSATGRKHSEESKKKMSDSMIGNKRSSGKTLSEDTKYRLSKLKARLTDNQIICIRNDRILGLSYKELSEKHNVSESVIGKIITFKSYKYINPLN